MRENENYEDAATSHGGTAVGIASMTTEVVSLVPPSNNGDLRNHPLKEPEPACLSRVMPELRLIPAVAPDWAGEIKRIWAEGGANTLQLAKIVSMARKQLARGEWSELWRSGEVPFSKSKANMLIAIYLRLAGLNDQTFGRLPRGWSILYELARLEVDELEHLVREGIVHPELTLAEASKLTIRRKRRGTKPKRHPVKAWMRELAAFVENTHDEWSIEQRKLASAKLREILLEIEQPLACAAQIQSTILATQNQKLKNEKLSANTPLDPH